MELLGHEDYLRILLSLRKEGGLRFSQIEKLLGLNPTEVDRALKFLRKGLWVVPHTISAEKGRILVEYRLGKRGAAFLESFKTFTADVQRRKAALGPSEVAQFQSLYR